jgi:diguanylate cyclase (GGDEF)-like protein
VSPTLHEAPGTPTRLALALAMLLCGSLLTAGVLLTSLAEGHEDLWTTSVSSTVLVPLFAALFYAGHRYSVDFELRRESHSVTLVQVPLALGVMFLAPWAHLAARLAGPTVLAVGLRQAPLKALWNISSAAFEVGAVVFAVGLVQHPTPGPAVWLALYGGLLLGDVVGAVGLAIVWWLVGVPVTLRAVGGSLLVIAPATLVFTALSIVALSAAEADYSMTVVLLVLAGMLALGYRTYRKVVGQQQATQKLYDFTKDLGPLDLDSPAAPAALERMRVLLHAQRLDLALLHGGSWCHLVATEDQPPCHVGSLPPGASVPRAALRGPALGSHLGGDEDTMVTPLLAGAELAGVLTATGRLGATRRFDMGDLRLLETVGAELATALDRGRLLTNLERSATTDALTDLPNLPETTRRLEALLDEHRRVVLAAVAVLSFKEVNETLGRELGDELLLEIARRLRLTYPDAVVGRVGGARFAVAVPASAVGTDPEHFGLTLRSQIEGTAQLGAVGTHVRLSVGLTQAPEHGGHAARLLQRAETAMHSARHVGGGPVLWAPAYEVLGNRRLAVVLALREALSSGALGVAYQPKVVINGGRVSGVEALVRWTHPALGDVGPAEFVPLAEASGLMGPLTATVLRQSLAACREWQSCAPGVGVSVNVSADTVLDASFVTEVAGLLAEARVPAALLTLELTESVLLEDPMLAAERMAELRALGLRLAVDDFGTGYSSLTYLRGLPVDEVKIDKGFVDGLVNDAADRVVVKAVVEIAHTLGLRVVAEGAENDEQVHILQSLGVDEVQGFLHARPMRTPEVSSWLQEHATRRVL